MYKTTLTLVLTLAPAALLAQASGQVQSTSQGSVSAQAQKGSVSAGASGQSQTSADGKVDQRSMSGNASSSTSVGANGDVQPPRGWSAGARERLTAIYAEARAQRLPVRPIARRVAEGRAKGAAEGTILASAGNVKAGLSTAQEAMVSAGRDHPSDAELEFAARALERGVTKAQISDLVRHPPSDRSLVVALDVLANGNAGTGAGATGGRTTGAVAGQTTGAAAATATGAANGTANAAGRGVTGTVTGAVAGTVQKP